MTKLSFAFTEGNIRALKVSARGVDFRRHAKMIYA